MTAKRFACILLAGSALLGDGVAIAQPAPARTAQPVPNAADARLRALYDGYAAWDAKESEYFEDARGETKPTANLQHGEGPCCRRIHRNGRIASRRHR